jgi:hypothetical protein
MLADKVSCLYSPQHPTRTGARSSHVSPPRTANRAASTGPERAAKAILRLNRIAGKASPPGWDSEPCLSEPLALVPQIPDETKVKNPTHRYGAAWRKRIASRRAASSSRKTSNRPHLFARPDNQKILELPGTTYRGLLWQTRGSKNGSRCGEAHRQAGAKPSRGHGAAGKDRRRAGAPSVAPRDRWGL